MEKDVSAMVRTYAVILDRHITSVCIMIRGTLFFNPLLCLCASLFRKWTTIVVSLYEMNEWHIVI